MKTIKVFLASSKELKMDRLMFGDLVQRLNKIYEPMGLKIELAKWEDMDAAYNGCPKQEEYDAEVRSSEMFLALFHTVAGEFTVREFHVAAEERERRGLPKTFVFCRVLQPGDVETAELKEFKHHLLKELGHFWRDYANSESLLLDFVLQLLQMDDVHLGKPKVENGQVVLDGVTVASLDNLPFAAGNEGYQRMKAELEALPPEIEKARLRMEKYPNDEGFRDDLQSLLDRQNALQEEFAKHQNALFDTALRISEMQLRKVSDELKRAIDEFEAGRVEAANAILDGIEREAERHLEQLDSHRALVHQDIEALLLKTKTLMADASIELEERIQQTWDTYRKADDWAERSALPKEKYIDLLRDYGEFLYTFGKYDEASGLFNRAYRMCLDLHGEESLAMGDVYNCLSVTYSVSGDNEKALDYSKKALEIAEKLLSPDHLDVAMSYNNLGSLYFDKSDYALAMNCFQHSLSIREKVLGHADTDVAMSYNNLGIVYNQLGDNERALECFQKGLEIRKKLQGEDSLDTVAVIINLATFYAQKLGDNDKALELLMKALVIRQKLLGPNHPETALILGNIGNVFLEKGEYERALEYYLKNKDIYVKVFGDQSPRMTTIYNNLGVLYARMEDRDLALEYFRKSLEICERSCDADHPDIAQAYNNIAKILADKGEYGQALESYMKALEIYKNKFGEGHADTVLVQNNIEQLLEKVKGGQTLPGSSGCMLVFVPLLFVLSLAVKALFFA